MIPRVPAPLLRLGLNAFRRLPVSIRRRAVRAGTPSFTVGTVAVIRDAAGRVLLLQQRHTPGWALPGGLLDPSESPEAAVTRELREELGLDVETRRLMPATPNAIIDPIARRVDVVFALDGPADMGIDVDGLEVLEARWFAPEALPRCQAGTYAVLRACGVAPLAP